MLTKVSGPVRLADRVADLLAEEIRSGRLVPGDKLPTEVELVQQLGVSRTVVREAVSRLRNAGLVEPRQGRGVFVMAARMEPLDLSAEASGAKAKVLQIVETRRAMESEAAALAAERATDGDLERLRGALAAIDDAVALGGDGVDEDLTFHRAVAESTHNAVMAATLRYLGEVSREGIRITRANEARRADFFEEVRHEHLAIVEAIAARDPKAARAAARSHLSHAARRLQDADEGFWTETSALDVDLDPGSPASTR